MKYLFCLGSNLGDRKKQLQEAIEKMAQKIENIKCSAIYEFPALLPEQFEEYEDWNKAYYNLAVLGESSLPPEEMLAFVKDIEKEMGRPERERWAPRNIDIDILLAEDMIILNKTDFIIPHYAMLERDFVMIPACEIASEWIHPITESTLQHHLDEIESDEYRIIGKLNCKL